MFNILKQKRMINPLKQDLEFYAKLTDKYNVKNEINNISNLHVANVYGVYNSFDEINIDKLPEKFVIKVNHWCGDGRFVNNKQEFIKNYQIYKQYYNSLVKNKYSQSEKHYGYIKPCIFTEEFLEMDNDDYNIHCVHGKAVIICVLKNRNCYLLNIKKNISFEMYSKEWKKLNFTRYNNAYSNNISPKPELLNEMIKIAEKLSENIDYVRIDLYISNGKVYFGEYTFTPGGCGHPHFSSHEFEKYLHEIYNKKNIDYDKIDSFSI